MLGAYRRPFASSRAPVTRSTIFPPHLAEVSSARRFVSEVAEDAGFSAERVFDISVACSEAIANAIEHSPFKGEVRVRTLLYPDRLEVEIRGPGEFQAPDRMKERNSRGLGLPLMAKLSDHLAMYSHPGGGTLVTLTFFLPGGDGGETNGPLPPSIRELIESNEFISAITEAALEGICVLGPDLRFRWTNDTWRALLDPKWRSLDLTGLSLAEVVPGAEEAGLVDTLRSVAETGAIRTEEDLEFHGLERGVTHWSWRALPFRQERLSPPYDVLVVMAESTEQKRIEKALRESEEKYCALVETNVDCIWELDSQGRYTYCSPQMKTLWGFEPAAMLGNTPFDMMPPEARESEEVLFRELLASAAPFSGIQVVSHDGRGGLIHAEVSGVPILDEVGRVTGFRGVARDVTERKRAEDALHRSEAALRNSYAELEERVRQRTAELAQAGAELQALIAERLLAEAAVNTERQQLNAVLDMLPVYTVLLSEDYHVPFANQFFEERFGKAEGRRCFDYLFGRTEPCENCETFKVLETNNPHHWEWAGPDGRNYEVFDYPFTDTTGRRLIMETGLDVTDRLRAVRDLRESRDELERRVADRTAELRESEHRHRTLAEENERLYRQQLDIAENLQMALLNIPSQLGPVRIGHLYRSATEAAHVGGDFYDVFKVRGDKVVLLIGDVAGHGIEAARTATFVKDVVHAFTHQSLRPHQILRRTNTLLVEKSLAGFVTMFVGVLDTETGLLRYSSAGHPEMLLRRSSGDVQFVGTGALPLGVFPEASWKTSEVDVEVGDLLLLYTDGVLEARRNGELFGHKRLEAVLKRKRISVERLPEFVLKQVLAFSHGTLQDDVAMVAISLKGQESGEKRSTGAQQ